MVCFLQQREEIPTNCLMIFFQKKSTDSTSKLLIMHLFLIISVHCIAVMSHSIPTLNTLWVASTNILCTNAQGRQICLGWALRTFHIPCNYIMPKLLSCCQMPWDRRKIYCQMCGAGNIFKANTWGCPREMNRKGTNWMRRKQMHVAKKFKMLYKTFQICFKNSKIFAHKKLFSF